MLWRRGINTTPPAESSTVQEYAHWIMKETHVPPRARYVRPSFYKVCVFSCFQSRHRCGLGQVLACHSLPFMCREAHDRAQAFCTGCWETALSFHSTHGWSKGKKAGFTCVELWPLAMYYDVVYISSLELYPEHADTCSAFPEREKQCSTDLGFNLHLITGWLVLYLTLYTTQRCKAALGADSFVCFNH